MGTLDILQRTCVEEWMFVAAAKLGRRSHKMRELISEATRTVEDSQTAQALHGLLSLKSPTDCPPSATSALLTSVGELSMELIQQASTGFTEHQTQVQAAGIHEADIISPKTPTKSSSQSATSKSADRHSTLRAAILSPGAAGLQPVTATAGSAVQILLQMQQDDSSATAKVKPLRAKLAPSASAGNISVLPTTSSVGINTTRMLLDRSVPVKIGATSSTAKAAAASVPLSGVIQVSEPNAGQAVPIQLIATSQGVLAIPHNYKLLPQNAFAALDCAATAASAGRVTLPTVVSTAKRRLNPSTSAGGLLKVAKLRTTATQSQGTTDTKSAVVQSEPTTVVANSIPHTSNEGVLSEPSCSLNQPLQTVIRDSYEKLFWKVHLQSSSFQSMPRPPVEDFNGSSEVSKPCLVNFAKRYCTGHQISWVSD